MCGVLPRAVLGRVARLGAPKGREPLSKRYLIDIMVFVSVGTLLWGAIVLATAAKAEVTPTTTTTKPTPPPIPIPEGTVPMPDGWICDPEGSLNCYDPATTTPISSTTTIRIPTRTPTTTTTTIATRFSDVTGKHPVEAIEWAADQGITRGCGPDIFCPDQPLKRKHALTFMERFYDQVLANGDFTRADMVALLYALNCLTTDSDRSSCLLD